MFDMYIRKLAEICDIPAAQKAKIKEHITPKTLQREGSLCYCPMCGMPTPKMSRYCCNCGQRVTLEEPVTVHVN